MEPPTASPSTYMYWGCLRVFAAKATRVSVFMGLRRLFSFLGVLGAGAQIPLSLLHPLLLSDLVVTAAPRAWHAGA